MACQIFDPLVSPDTPQEKLGFRLGMAHDISLSSLLSHPTPTHNLSPAMDATYLGRGWGNWIHIELLVSETCQHFSRLSAEQKKKEQSGYDLGPKLRMASKSQWEKTCVGLGVCMCLFLNEFSWELHMVLHVCPSVCPCVSWSVFFHVHLCPHLGTLILGITMGDFVNLYAFLWLCDVNVWVSLFMTRQLLWSGMPPFTSLTPSQPPKLSSNVTSSRKPSSD